MTSDTAAPKMMRCAMCGREKNWRDGFPTSIYAECWQCVWERHVDQNHRPKRRWHLRCPLHRDPVDEKANAAAAVEVEQVAVASADRLVERETVTVSLDYEAR